MSRIVSLAVVLLAPLLTGGKCPAPNPPLATVAGLPEYQGLATVAVPGGVVNVAGGNLSSRFVSLSIDTRLGTQRIGAVHNSATRTWLWSFDISYDGTTFVDPTGASYNVGALTNGSSLAGTHWVKVDATTLKTKGGLVHEFDAGTGRLVGLRWATSDHPRLNFVQTLVAGAPHTTAIDQCSVAGSCSAVFTIQYDASGRVTSITDRAGRMADFAYDASGNLSAARDGLDVAKGWTGLTYEYDGDRIVARTNSEGERIEFDWLSSRVTQVRPIGEENPVYSFSYHGKSGGLYHTIATDPVGARTRYAYDAARRVRSIEAFVGTDPIVSELTTYQWAGNRPSLRTDPAGATTQWTYVEDDVDTMTLPSGNIVRYAYAAHPDAVARDRPGVRPVSSVVDGIGIVETRTYDGQGRLRTFANGAGETTTLTYDAEEMLESEESPDGTVTAFTGYGDHGHATVVTRGEFTFERAYDVVGNLTQGSGLDVDTGPGWGGVVSRSFDADRNVAEVELADLVFAFPTQSRLLRIEHRSDGQRLSIARPYGGEQGGDTVYLYDGLGRLSERRDKATVVGQFEGAAAWQSTHFAFDALGRRTSVERPNGMQEDWSYDARGRVTLHRILQDGVEESSAVYSYAQGRLDQVLDSVHGAPRSYSYDLAGRVSSVSFPDGESFTLLYDARSRATSQLFWRADDTLLRVLHYAYDGADREILARDDGVDLGGSSLDLLGRHFTDARLDQLTYGNGLVRAIQWDTVNGIPSSLQTTGPSGIVEDTATDIRSGFLCSAMCLDTQTETFGSLARKTGELHVLGPEDSPSLGKAGIRVWHWDGGGSDSPVESALFDWDEISNLTLSGSGNPGLEHLYNPERNRLLQVQEVEGPTVHTYAYDEAGYVTDRDGLSLDWDGAGRIRGLGTQVALVWDTEGRLVSASIAGVQTRRLFGGLVEADAAGNPTALDLVEARLDLTVPTPGAVLYRHLDQRGNVKWTSDAQGEVRAHYQYGPFGEVASYGDTGTTEEDVGFALGRRYAGLVLLGHRPLDAVAARFLSPDPVYQLINQYTYALGNPLWLWDPDGRSAQGTLTGLSLGLSVTSLALGLAAVAVAPAAAPVLVLTLSSLVIAELAIGLGVVAAVGFPAAEDVPAVPPAVIEGAMHPEINPSLPDISGNRAWLARVRGGGSGALGGSSSGGGGGTPGGGGCGLGWELAPLLLAIRASRSTRPREGPEPSSLASRRRGLVPSKRASASLRSS